MFNLSAAFEMPRCSTTSVNNRKSSIWPKVFSLLEQKVLFYEPYSNQKNLTYNNINGHNHHQNGTMWNNFSNRAFSLLELAILRLGIICYETEKKGV